MSLYDDLKNVASGVLAEFKQGVVQYVEMTPTPGATPDRRGAAVPVTTTINATVAPVSSRYVDGTNIVQSDEQVTMPNDGVEPKMNGSIVIDGVKAKIIQIMRRPAAGTVVTYTLIVRR